MWGTSMTMTSTKRCPYCVEEIHEDAIKCKHCGSWLAQPPDPFTRATVNGHADFAPGGFAGKGQMPRISRATGADSMWYGVCAGLARFLGVDPTWVRVVVALATVATGFFPGLVVYLIMGWIIPADTAGQT
jgi:phage shock protein C